MASANARARRAIAVVAPSSRLEGRATDQAGRWRSSSDNYDMLQGERRRWQPPELCVILAAERSFFLLLARPAHSYNVLMMNV
jgi:hypothetical protein